MRFEATLDAATPTDRLIPERVVAGPIGLEFESTVAIDGGRLRAHGVAPGAGFVLDAELTEHDGALHVSGELQVSGTLAGLGQRELELHARRLVSALAGLR